MSLLLSTLVDVSTSSFPLDNGTASTLSSEATSIATALSSLTPASIFLSASAIHPRLDSSCSCATTSTLGSTSSIAFSLAPICSSSFNRGVLISTLPMKLPPPPPLSLCEVLFAFVPFSVQLSFSIFFNSSFVSSSCFVSSIFETEVASTTSLSSSMTTTASSISVGVGGASVFFTSFIWLLFGTIFSSTAILSSFITTASSIFVGVRGAGTSLLPT
mmetsp:Transcript_4002/g.8817  ORF Transcript_4002/g.8817 Transcript_4002/m.8817 type:complete len:217 (-) Transcript_4002:295-945(-)